MGNISKPEEEDIVEANERQQKQAAQRESRLPQTKKFQ